MIKKLRKIVLIASSGILMSGCIYGESIHEKWQENEYFNSESAAEILFEKSMELVKHGTIISQNMKKMDKVYYIWATEDHPRIYSFNIPKDYDRNMTSYGTIYYRDGIIEGDDLGYGLEIYYDKHHQKSKITFSKESPDFTFDYTYHIGCSLSNKPKYCYLRAVGKNNDVITFMITDELSMKKIKLEIFNKYYKNTQKLIKNRKFNHENLSIEYFFYRDKKEYKVVCDLLYKKCKIELPDLPYTSYLPGETL